MQSGGQFDIDWDVTGPDGHILLSGSKERQGDYVFSAKQPGDFSFCFSNIFSTFAEKTIDFDITAEHEVNQEMAANLPIKLPQAMPGAEEKKAKIKEATMNIQYAFDRISSSISDYHRLMRILSTRDNRNLSTVLSTEQRIVWFSMSEIVMIIAMSFLQVFAIRKFFSKGSKIRI